MLWLMMFVWGVIMMVEMLLCWWMVVSWLVECVLVVLLVMGYMVFVCLLLWMFWYWWWMCVCNSVDILGCGGVIEIVGC